MGIFKEHSSYTPIIFQASVHHNSLPLHNMQNSPKRGPPNVMAVKQKPILCCVVGYICTNSNKEDDTTHELTTVFSVRKMHSRGWMRHDWAGTPKMAQKQSEMAFWYYSLLCRSKYTCTKMQKGKGNEQNSFCISMYCNCADMCAKNLQMVRKLVGSYCSPLKAM